MARRPVPNWPQCEHTIKREANWWRPKFRKALSFQDLVQEGWLVAEKVLRAYDPTRNAKMETLLTLALRRHFARLINTELRRALSYSPKHVEKIWLARASEPRVSDPRASLAARLLVLKLRTLPKTEQRLAYDLLRCEKIPALARARRWSIPFTRERVQALRKLLKED